MPPNPETKLATQSVLFHVEMHASKQVGAVCRAIEEAGVPMEYPQIERALVSMDPTNTGQIDYESLY